MIFFCSMYIALANVSTTQTPSDFFLLLSWTFTSFIPFCLFSRYLLAISMGIEWFYKYSTYNRITIWSTNFANLYYSLTDGAQRWSWPVKEPKLKLWRYKFNQRPLCPKPPIPPTPFRIFFFSTLHYLSLLALDIPKFVA